MRILLSDGHGQQLHVVGAVVTISARLGHRESICTSSVMCGRAAESVSAAAGSLAAVAAHLLLCPLSLSPLFQAARPSWASRRLRDPVVFVPCCVVYLSGVVCAQMGGLGETKVTFGTLAVTSVQ